ncbi:MAG TPA: ester cyclase [Vicinamibacterales bacterium]|nr:ester cyclase [Vicinamibacterales bacterium]
MKRCTHEALSRPSPGRHPDRCRLQQPAPAEKPAEPPKPAWTGDQSAQKYKDCWDQFNRKDWTAFRSCYGPAITVEAVDSGRPVVSGLDAAVKDAQDFVAAFPDVTGSVQLVLASKDSVAGLAVVSGTHGGPLPGPDGKPIAATNKKVGYMMGLVVDLADGAVVKERQYADNTTMLAQIGVIKAPTRPLMTGGAPAPTVVISTGSDTERAAVDTFRANMAAFNAHDQKTLAAMNAADGVFHDYTQAKDMTSADNITGLVQLFKGFPDAMLEAASMWGAGDYVVTEGTFSGTNKGAVPMMGIKKPTGKTAKVRFLEITKIEAGKIEEDWLVFDSMAFAAQLGL